MNDETLNYNLFLQSKYYIDNQGLETYWDKMYNYFIGNQFKQNFDKNLPKVVTNICGKKIRDEVSKIIGTPFSLNFTIYDNTKSSLNLQQFDKYIQERMQEEEFNYQTCQNGLVYGTAITYFCWDKDDTTVDGRYIGGLKQEHIDINQFRVANPYIHDIQKQEWVMFVKAVPVGAVKAMMKDKEKAKFICPDTKTFEELNHLNEVEVNAMLVTLIYRFFRIDGEVCYQISTRNVDVTDVIPMNPNFSIPKKLLNRNNEDDDRAIHEYKGVDYEDVPMNLIDKEKSTPEKYKKIKSKFGLYPFAVYVPTPRDKSMYGKSEIQEIIPIQKALNQIDSMFVLEITNTGMGKTIVKKDALKGQKINTDPRQVIVDYTQGNSWGVQRMQGNPISNSGYSYAESLLARARNIYGFDEISPSVATTKNLSGVAIQLINEEKNTAIEQAQRRFWNYCVDKAYVRLLFYKFYYAKIQYVITLNDDEFKAEEKARNAVAGLNYIEMKQQGLSEAEIGDFIRQMPPAKREQTRYFEPETIQDDSFDIAIEAGRGTRYSEIVVADMFNNLVLNGGMQNMDYHSKQLFFKCYPLLEPEMKKEIFQVLNEQKNDEISQMQQASQDLQGQLQQVLQYAKSLESQLGVQSEYTKQLTKEFTNKINAANDEIGIYQNIVNNYSKQNQKGSSKKKIEMPSGDDLA